VSKAGQSCGFAHFRLGGAAAPPYQSITPEQEIVPAFLLPGCWKKFYLAFLI
jgi:hypothetical protein